MKLKIPMKMKLPTKQTMKHKVKTQSKMIVKLIKMVPLMTTKVKFLSSKMRLKMVFLTATMTTKTTRMMMEMKMMATFHLFQKEVVSHFVKFIKQRRKRSQRKIKRKHFGVLLLVEMVFSLLVCICSLMILSPRLGCTHHH